MYDEKFSYTSQFITKNEKAWFPFMGEIHYSRYSEKFWKEALLKMKAGGVTIVSSYVIWIHHEEIEGQWDWEGQKNLRRFVQLVKECGLYMILRIGPWSHAEVRNGGFPDWLLNKGFEPRTNDESYFNNVKLFYQQTFDQVKGLLLKDGGPIIGVQIENEFGHCGGLTGEAGEAHMKRLESIAHEVGFDVPLYTATGWGGAITAGMLPVMGGYVDAPWDQRPVEIEPSGNYVITHERNDHNIGSDFGFCTGITFDIKKYPYLTAELGGGLEPTFLRRPVPTKEDIGAEALVKMASGVSLLGYYMYHGGTNPKGKLSTLQESRATGSLNDLPELSYDFFAPLREYGQASPTYGELKLYSLFAADFGSDLCKMPSVIPEDNPLAPEDTEHLRYAFRIDEASNEKSGFLFVNNYVRHQKQAAHKNVCIKVPGTQIEFSDLNIENGDYFFLPFNMKVGDAILEKAYATPLCKLCQKDGREAFVFYKNAASEGRSYEHMFIFKDNKAPTNADIVLISREEALASYKVCHDGSDYLFIFDGELMDDGGRIYLRGKNVSQFCSYPELPKTPNGFKAEGADIPLFAKYSAVQKEAALPKVEVSESVKKEDGKKFYSVKIAGWTRGENLGNGIRLDDMELNLYYNGSYGRLYENGSLVADNLFCGRAIPWQIGLRHLGSGEKAFELEIQQLMEETKVYLEDKPEFFGGVACNFVRSQVNAVYSAEFEI